MSAPSRKKLAAGQIRSLRAIRTKLLNMSAEWDGVDQFSMGTLSDLADKCESVAAELLEQPAVEDFE